jgi:hypothetical protein
VLHREIREGRGCCPADARLAIRIPLAIAGILGSSVGGNLTGLVQAIGDAIISVINAIGGIGRRREGVAVDLTAKHGKLAVELARILSPLLLKGMMRNGLHWVGRRLTRGEPSTAVENIAEPCDEPHRIIAMPKLFVDSRATFAESTITETSKRL